MLDLITMGEVLIDFVPFKKGVSLKENQGFFREPGGAPANVAVGVAKLGGKAAFLGKIGQDFFGDYLLDILRENGVELSGVVRTDQAKTALAFVSLTEEGERDFVFYRQPSADMLYRPDELKSDFFSKAKIFHFGSISMINSPFRETTIKALAQAKANNKLISFDPNLRPLLWPDLELAQTNILQGLKHADIVKVSKEELEFITGESDLDQGSAAMLKYGLQLLFVTLGADGCYYRNSKFANTISGFPVKVEDTTGAGDGFMAGVLYKIAVDYGGKIDLLGENDLNQIALFGNATGALTTTGKGAINSLPLISTVKEFLG